MAFRLFYYLCNYNVISKYYKKKTHRRKEGGWLAFRRDSKYKKKCIIAKDVVGLLVGDSKNDSLIKIKSY